MFTFLREVSSEKDTYIEFKIEMVTFLIQWILFVQLHSLYFEKLETAASKTNRLAFPMSDRQRVIISLCCF